MMDSYLFGMDIGTYSSKGVLVESGSGKMVASHTIEHTLSMPKLGWVEHDADAIWWDEFRSICRHLLVKSQILPEQVQGVGISGIGNCVLPIDEKGKPLRPAILYGIDTRATEEIKQLELELGKEQIFQVCATHLSSSASGPKILWLKNHEPEVYKKARWFLNSHSYVIYRLTGRATVDIYTACGYAPLMDVEKRSWYAPAAKAIAPMHKLPELVWSCEVVGGITAEAAEQTGLAEGTPVIGGAIDAAAEAISAGIRDFGDMMMMFGSSNSIILKSKKLIRTENFWALNWVEPGTYSVVGGMSTVGSLTRWFRDTLSPTELAEQEGGGANAYTALSALAEVSPPGANGLIALPYFEGERTPIYDPDAKGALFGLTLKHNRADMYRALLESIGYGIRHNVESLQGEGLSAKRILAVGGGTKNLAWMQIISDIANVQMVVPEEQIGSSYGGAFMAGVGVGVFSSLQEIDRWVSHNIVIQPDPVRNAAYAPYYQIYRDLYQQTSHLMHDLANLTRA